MYLLLSAAVPLSGPLRSVFLIGVLLVCAGTPLALALWRLQSRNRLRHIRIAYSDRDALVYQVTKIAALVGCSQGPTAGQAILFVPNGVQRAFGMKPLELLFDRPGSARFTATHGIMRRIAHNFRGATEEKYTGPNAFPMKGFLTAFGLLLAITVVFLAVVGFMHSSGSAGGPRASTGDLDVEQPLDITAVQAERGEYVSVKTEHTGQLLQVHIPRKTTDGTRLRFKGIGRAPADGGPAGDFYLVVHIQ